MLRLETASNDLSNAAIQFHGGGTNANWTVGTNRSDIAGNVGNLFFNCNFGTKMVIQNTGNVGIGTTNPTSKLNVESSPISGDTEIAHFSAPTSLSGSAYTSFGDGYVGWDYGYGGLSVNAHSAGGSVGGIFVKRVDNGHSNVGIGTINPLTALHVQSASAGATALRLTDNIRATLDIDFPATSQLRFGVAAAEDILFASGGATLMTIKNVNSGGNVGIGTTNPGSYKLYVAGAAYSTGGWSSSDARWKKDIQPLEDSLSNVLKLQGVSYLWKTEEFPKNGFTEGRQIGLIAQELEKILHELVHTDKEGYKSVSYDKLTAILIEAVKEQQKQIEAQQEQINDLKSEKNGKIASLENDIAELKEAMSNAIMLTSVK